MKKLKFKNINTFISSQAFETFSKENLKFDNVLILTCGKLASELLEIISLSKSKIVFKVLVFTSINFKMSTIPKKY